MIYFKSGRLYFLLSLLATIFVISSCKKEYVKYPYNEIEQFTIQDATGANLKATIVGTDIIVYYPPFQVVPDFISPTITVSEKASVSPASGTKITFKTGAAFKVTAQDGSIKTYTLKVASNQPAATFTVSDTKIGESLSIQGEFIVVDTNRTKLFLVDKNNKDIKLPASLFDKFTAANLNLTVPSFVDTGFFKVKLLTDNKPVIKGPIHIGPPQLLIGIPETVTTVKRGGILTITSDDGSLNYYKQVLVRASISVDIFTDKPANIISITDKEIKLQVPVDFPLIKIESIYLFDKNDGIYGSIDRSGNGIQVTE